MSISKAKHVRYTIYCGDANSHFRFGKKEFKESEILEVIRTAMSACKVCGHHPDTAQGLVVQDLGGNLFEPRVQVTLVPYQRRDHEERVQKER